MCISTNPGLPSAPHPVSAHARAISASHLKPLTSFTISAPAFKAARAVAALYVSTEIIASGRARSIPSSTGSSRACSSSELTDGPKAETVELPGRVLSAPRSRMSAPSSSNRSPCSTAASGSRNRPPSLNESGVMLTVPITSVRRPSSSVRLRSCQCVTCRAETIISFCQSPIESSMRSSSKRRVLNQYSYL